MPTPRKHANQAERQAAYRRRLAESERQARTAPGLPRLPAVPSIPGHRRWEAMARQATWLLHSMHDEMEAYYEERSEAWQESEKGDAFLERIEATKEAVSSVEELEP